MPTSFEFEQAAASFDAAADRAERLLEHTRRYFGPDTMRDGKLPLLADVTVDTAVLAAASVADELRGQADTCRIRAEACRTYSRQLATYGAEMDRWQRNQHRADESAAGGQGLVVAGPRPRRPSRPSFVEI